MAKEWSKSDVSNCLRYLEYGSDYFYNLVERDGRYCLDVKLDRDKVDNELVIIGDDWLNLLWQLVRWLDELNKG